MAPSDVGGLTSKGTAGVTKLTSGTTASESSMHSAPQLMGLAMSGVPATPMNMFTAVRPTPMANEHHAAAFEIFPEYSPQKKGPRNAPASAPHE